MEHVATRFGAHVVHEDMNLCVHTGEILGLVGGSGSGKTTLMREMIGLETPSGGTISVFDQRLDKMSFGALKRMRDRIGVLFQNGAMFSAFNVRENIALPLRELHLLDDELIDELVQMKLRMVGLEKTAAQLMPAELSGGMVKRAALARALVLEPELLFLDEPTAGLDPIASERFVDLLDSLHRDLNFTVVMVTHDLNTLADLCDRVAVLADAKLVALGPLAEVVQSDHPFVRAFFHGHRSERLLEATNPPVI
jgi:phospholipid/cholesterol/gamma-HCH transport system ATP-binding protein